MAQSEETIERNFKAVQGFSQDTRKMQRETEAIVANLQTQVLGLTARLDAMQVQMGVVLASRGTGATS